MAGFGEVPFIERPGGAPAGVSTSVPERPANAQDEDNSPSSVFAPFPSPQFRGIHNYPPVKVDRALFNGDVVEVGPLSVTAYLAPGHTASSTSFFYTVRDDGRDYRVLQWCCWELPDDYSRSPFLSEAGVRHTLALYRELLPIDIYLETGSYAWSGILNQASGTWAQRMARLREDGAPWVNRDIFRSLAAAREVSFEQLLGQLKRAGTHPAYSAP